MNYPWLSNFLFEAADPEVKIVTPDNEEIKNEEDDTTEDDGTNEPFDSDKEEDIADESKEEKVESDTTDESTDTSEDKQDTDEEDTIDTSTTSNDEEVEIVKKPPQTGNKSTAEIEDVKQEIQDLKEQLDEIKGTSDLENEVEKLKKRLDDLDIPDSADLNDSLFQIAKKDIKIIKRAIRRCYAKSSSLDGKQQEKILNELKMNPHLTYQEISKKLSGVLGARQNDIFDFLMNTDYGFRHRHRRYI